jgi:co-chaperonin GroES (HSP10)
MFNSVSTEGEVVSAPYSLGRNSFNEPYGNKVMVEAGDHVYFHPNTTRPASDMGYEGLFCTAYEMLFAKRLSDGSISMIGDNCFCDPIMEAEEDIKTKSGIWIKPEAGSKLMRAVLKYVGHPRKQERIYFRDFRLEAGMEIIYAQNADIPITIGEQKLVRMKIEDIVAVMISGQPIMRNRYLMLIQDDAKTEEGSLIIADSIQKKPNTGVIVRSGKGVHLEGAFTGDRVLFHDKGLMKFEWEGVEYGFIDVNYCYGKEEIA